MIIAVASPEETILAAFSSNTREKIKKGEAKLKGKVVALADEGNDEVFALFYAFYKDDAYTRRLTIPTYREMASEMHRRRDSAYLLFAYQGKIPVAALWAYGEKENLLLRAAGSVGLGYEFHADYFLLRHAIILAKQQKKETVSFDEKTFFHGMISL